MESAGVRLKKLRLEKGIPLEEVHKKTRIHLDILKAIEEDSFLNLNPIYIKGFLKIYCKFLGVDPRDYISDYRETQGMRPVYQRKESTSLFKANLLKITPPNLIYIKKIVFVVVLILISSIGLFNLGKNISSKSRPVSKKAGLADQSVKLPQTPIPTAIRLLIRAKEDCWIQLKTDGKVVFQSVLKKGRFENWEAESKIELSLGNAGVVDLEVNGKLISNLGRRGQVLKNILITKEGISIGR
ncbi:MAG: DUF4115 domain-containing protein [Candidatus Omnitrophica bacterium]|nr:DUF4115 domain-containing protein [Candidatus Omnitrophota bacterium]MBU4473619.1 DUF4115 domain-containing protein [Candidatus Omnitrophota bacterium]MCG2706336.1 DUF4115 domain-containing protein [Candidatus Omnitrophota bacterium]